MKFREVPGGGVFEYQGRMFSKVRLNFAEDEKQIRFIFPSEAEVRALERVRQEKGEDVTGNFHALNVQLRRDQRDTRDAEI